MEVDRRAVLDAACAVFAERGFDGASVEVIAQRAQLARPAIYELFGSKQGLILATVADAADRLIERVDGVLGEPDLPWQAVVRRSLQGLFSLVEAHPEALTVLYLAESSPAVSADSGLAAGRRRVVSSITAQARQRWADEGVQVGPLADVVATMMFAMTEAVARHWMAGELDGAPVVEVLGTFVNGGIAALGEAGFGRAGVAVDG